MNTMVSQTVEPLEDRTLSIHQEHEFLLRLEKAGLIRDLATKVIDSKDNELAKKVVRLIQNGGFEPSTSHKLAREIMGTNMFGIEEAIKHFGVNPSKQQLAYLAQIPFTEEVLKSCQDTHILVAVFSLSILDIQGKVKRELFYSHGDAWYNNQAFASNKGEVGWQLVRKTYIAESLSKNWDEQQALLDKEESTPTAQIMVYTIIGHYLATGERLFENVYVRCSDLDSDGSRVSVGCFDAGGLFVNYDWDDHRDGLGVSSVRNCN